MARQVEAIPDAYRRRAQVDSTSVLEEARSLALSRGYSVREVARVVLQAASTGTLPDELRVSSPEQPARVTASDVVADVTASRPPRTSPPRPGAGSSPTHRRATGTSAGGSSTAGPDRFAARPWDVQVAAPSHSGGPPELDPQLPTPPRPAAPPTTITHEHVITGPIAETLYRSYLENFEPLAELAVLKHLDSKTDVLAYFANPRIVKIVAWLADEPVGLAMVTNSLEDLGEISPPFLRARYPEHAARNAIYVSMLVMVSKQLRGLTVFNRLNTELWQVPARDAGVLVFDACEFNRTMFDMDSLSLRIAAQFPQSRVEILDRQTWYVAELPQPIQGSDRPPAPRAR